MKLISITSGKGGVGKTTLTCNLAMSLANQGLRVLILDGDLGMANVDIFFGTRAKFTVKDLLAGVPINNCLTKLVKNIDLLAGGSGLHELMLINAFERREIVQQIQSLHLLYDYVLIDTAPGLHDYVLHLNSIADECLLLITQDPSSFADAYSLVKVMNQKYKTKNFSVICNMIAEQNGAQLFTRFSEVVEKFLTVQLGYIGSIPEDFTLKRVQQMQRLILRHTVESAAKSSFQEIGDKLIGRLRQNAPRAIHATDETGPRGLGGLFFQAPGHA